MKKAGIVDKIERDQKTMRAMRKQYPLGTCGICNRASSRIIGRLASDPTVQVCGDCYADRKVPFMAVIRA